MHPTPSGPSPRSPRRKPPGLAAALLLVAAIAPAAEAPLPAAGSPMTVNGTELWVHRLGQGDPIVVVHGGPMLDHGYLLPHLEPLAARHELVFYDQRLSGRSAPEVDPASVTLDTFVADLEALRVELELGRVHLLAHSFGGLVAMRYALAHGDNLRSLVLVGPTPASAELFQREQAEIGTRMSEADQARRREILATDAFGEGRPEAIEKALRLSFGLLFHDRGSIDRLRLYVPDDYMERSARFGALRPELAAFDLHAELAEVTVPTLLVYGETEPGAAIGGPALAAALPRSELVIVPASGHFPFVERPEAFLEAVRAFLDAAVRDGAP